MFNRATLSAPTHSRAMVAAGIVAGSLLMAAGAQVAIPVPWSPVPITGQTFTLALLVALLGTRGAVAALVLYIVEGAAGLPVFAPTAGAAVGIARLFGPTGGYLIAFPIAAFITGTLFDRGLWRTYPGRVVAIALGTLAVFAGGASWLANFVGWQHAVAFGVVPFLLGDALKSLLAAAVAPWLRSIDLPRL